MCDSPSAGPQRITEMAFLKSVCWMRKHTSQYNMHFEFELKIKLI